MKKFYQNNFLFHIVNKVIALATKRSSLVATSILSKIAVRAGTFLIIAPIIGPANQGTIVLTSTWAATVLLFMAYGLQVRALREVAIEPKNARALLVGDLRAMGVLLIPAVSAAIVVARFLLPSQDQLIFAILVAATIGTVVGDYCSATLRALDQFRIETAVSLSTSLLQMLFIIVAALMFDNLLVLASAIFVSRLVFALISINYVYRVTRHDPIKAPLSVKQSIRAGYKYFVDGSLSLLLGSIDILLLGQLVDKSTIGNYAVGSRIVQLFLVLPWIATNLFVPDLARAQVNEVFIPKFRRLIKIMLCIAACGALGMVLGGPLFTKWFLGEKYADLNMMWPAFAILVLVRFWEASYGIGMTALGWQMNRVWVQLAAIVSISIASLLLVGPFGIKGIIGAISITYCCVAIIYYQYMRNWTSIGFIPFWTATGLFISGSISTMLSYK